MVQGSKWRVRNLVDEAVIHGLLGGHEEIAVSVCQGQGDDFSVCEAGIERKEGRGGGSEKERVGGGQSERANR